MNEAAEEILERIKVGFIIHALQFANDKTARFEDNQAMLEGTEVRLQKII